MSRRKRQKVDYVSLAKRLEEESERNIGLNNPLADTQISEDQRSNTAVLLGNLEKDESGSVEEAYDENDAARDEESDEDLLDSKEHFYKVFRWKGKVQLNDSEGAQGKRVSWRGRWSEKLHGTYDYPPEQKFEVVGPECSYEVDKLPDGEYQGYFTYFQDGQQRTVVEPAYNLNFREKHVEGEKLAKVYWCGGCGKNEIGKFLMAGIYDAEKRSLKAIRIYLKEDDSRISLRSEDIVNQTEASSINAILAKDDA